MRYEDGSYGCKEGYYLYFYSSSNETCLTQEEINDSMYKVDGKDVYADEEACGYRLGMLTRKDGKTQVCIPIQTCRQNNMFVYERMCVTAAECVGIANDPDGFYSYYHAYAAT